MSKLSEQRVREFARAWYDKLLGNAFSGRVYLAGGVFKTLLHGRAPNDIDLFPVTDEGRYQLMKALQQQGAEVTRDNKPYQTVLNFGGQRVEVAYSTHYPTLKKRLARFDLGLSAIGVEYDNGTLKALIHSRAIESLQRGEVLLIKPLKNWKYALATLERMRRYARELDYRVPESEVEYIWGIFDSQSSEMRREMIDRFRRVSNGTPEIVEQAESRQECAF